MKNAIIVTLLAGSLVLVGCDKAQDAASKAGNAAKDAGKSAAGAAKDATKAVTDTAKDAAHTATDAAKSAGNAVKDTAKNAMDSTKDAAKGAMDAAKDKVDAAKTTLMDGVKKEVDAVKAKIDTLTKGGSTVKEADKAAYTKDVEGINNEYKTLNDTWTALSSGKADDWKKVGEELTAKARGLMDKVNAALTKYGIK